MTTSGITVFGQPSSPIMVPAGESPWTMPSSPPIMWRWIWRPPAFTRTVAPSRKSVPVRVREGHIVDQFQQLVNPLRPIPRQITTLTGITDAMVADLDPIDEVLPRFIAWLATPAAGPTVEPIVGHNVSFDLRFLDYNTRHIAGCGFACADYDTMQISRALFPAQRHHRLADLIVRFGIADNEEHRALSDAIQTQQCFEWMRHYVTEHHESEAIRWKQAPAKNSAEILHQQLVVKR